MKFIILMLFCVTAGTAYQFTDHSSRSPANYAFDGNGPFALGQIKLSTIENEFIEIAENSKIITAVNRFEMDPVTRVLNISLTLNYPIKNLLLKTHKLPEENYSEKHEVEFSVSFPTPKSLAYTKYLSLQFHKFSIDGESYINFFEIVFSVAKTILANTQLTNFFYVKMRDKIKNNDSQEILREILDTNGILVNHTLKTIKFKLDLNQFKRKSPHVKDYSDPRLWHFSPTLFQGREIQFKFIAGEGKPTANWIKRQNKSTAKDTKTLLQIRSDFFLEYSDLDNFDQVAKSYLQSLLTGEGTTIDQLPSQYKNEVTDMLNDFHKRAQNIFSQHNDNFIADPEYVYIQMLDAAKNEIRNFVARLDQRIKSAAIKNSASKPIIKLLLSEHLLNGIANFLTAIDFKENSIIKEAHIWMRPSLPGFILSGTLNVPLEYLISQIGDNFNFDKIKAQSHTSETDERIPFELHLQHKTLDHSIIGFDVKSFSIFKGEKRKVFTQNDDNHKFMIGLTKIFLANMLTNIEIGLPDIKKGQLLEDKKISSMISRFTKISNSYKSVSNSNENLEQILKIDFLNNPQTVVGTDYVKRKKTIILGSMVQFNKSTNLFEIAIGRGLRSQGYIENQIRRNGALAGGNEDNIYQSLRETRSTVNAIASIDFPHFEQHANQYLAEMVAANRDQIIQKAKASPGKTFYEVDHLSIQIKKDNIIFLNLKAKGATSKLTWRSLWQKSKISEESFSLTSEIILSTKEFDFKNRHFDLSTLVFYPQAIVVEPINIKVKFGKISPFIKALEAISNLSLNGKIGLYVKPVLLKVANNFMKKIYSKATNGIKGHKLEKIVRIYTDKNDLLIFLNPKVAGEHLDSHLTGEIDHLDHALKLNDKTQTLHLALTASAGMGKADKKALISLIKKSNNLISPYLKARSKPELQQLMMNMQLPGRLLNNTDAKNLGINKEFTTILSKYDRVLDTDATRYSKLSATGVELMYFASIAQALHDDLDKLVKLMKKFNLTGQQYRYKDFVSVRDVLSENILIPMITHYKNHNHKINTIIVNSDISHWTASQYPNAILAEKVYNLIK